MDRLASPIQSVLFVCTGNVFRSLAAEQALKVRLGAVDGYVVGSAGIDAKPQPVHDWVLTKLKQKGANASSHAPRQLTKEMIERTDLVIAMGRNHQTFIREQFGRDVPLFNQICLGHDSPVLDVHEAIPEWESDLGRARIYVWTVIETIWAAVPALLPRLR